MNKIEFKVAGKPIPKGSYFGRIRGWPNKNWNKSAVAHAVKRFVDMVYAVDHPVIDIMPTSKHLKKWEQKIRDAAEAKMSTFPEPFQGACRVYLVFYFKRPGHHYGKRDKKPYLKESSKRLFCTKAPDIDKVTRAVFDGMNKVSYRDDAYVVDMAVRKLWGKSSGVHVIVEELDQITPKDLPEMNQLIFNFGEQ